MSQPLSGITSVSAEVGVPRHAQLKIPYLKCLGPGVLQTFPDIKSWLIYNEIILAMGPKSKHKFHLGFTCTLYA